MDNNTQQETKPDAPQETLPVVVEVKPDTTDAPGPDTSTLEILTVDAVTDSANATAVAEIASSKIDAVSDTVESVAEKVDGVSDVAKSAAEIATEISNKLFEVGKWQQKMEALMGTVLDSQVKMMEAQTAFNLAMAAQSIPLASFARDEDDTPTIAPASVVSPSDPAQALPVVQAEEAIKNLARKTRIWT